MDASRRGFVGGIIGAAIAPVAFAGGGGGATGGDTGDLKLGVASYSFREFGRKIALAGTKKLNTPYINIKDFHLALNSNKADIEKFHKDIDKAGLTLLGCGNVSFTSTDEADIRSKFEYAKAAGFPLIVCAPTHETLPLMEKYVKQYDIKIALHNHGPEDKHFPTPQSVLQAMKGMDPRCGLCIDIGHTSRTGVDIVASIAEAGPRLLDMHVKDLADPMAKDSQVPVGDGKLPIPAIFRQLKKMNYQGGVMLEYEVDDTDPLPGMIKSFAYMRGVLAGLRT
jgi:sugar phosphate isomerase/epimerase